MYILYPPFLIIMQVIVGEKEVQNQNTSLDAQDNRKKIHRCMHLKYDDLLPVGIPRFEIGLNIVLVSG